MRVYERRSRRPGQDSAASKPLVEDFADRNAPERHGRGETLLAQLRRRHDAARRLPPLPHSARRDPLSPRERADGWARE